MQFSQNGKMLAPDVVPEVYIRFSGVTSCLQRIMNVLFLTTAKGEMCTIDMIDEAINYLLDLYTEHYQTLVSQMSEKQRSVFFAIAAEKRIKGISSGKFVHKYRLPSPSSVVSAVKGLMDKDFITQDDGEYYVYDHFFQLWLEREAK